jgi:hypothetical protein
MENRTIKIAKIGTLFIVVILIISSETVMASTSQKASSSSMTKIGALFDSSNGETELKYYQEEGLSTVIGVGPNAIWKSAIRLTQDEMAAYTDWTMTKVNVAFDADDGCSSMTIRIYIYDEGNDTHPGPIIANDTTYTLNQTGVTTIPLITPVNLSDHDELWVAVEWKETEHGGGAYYAWLDTTTGPHVPQKGDFYYLNHAWGEIYTGGADFDGNWGIGAIVEGASPVELSIGNIKGPMGIKADVSNVGENDANNVQWSIAVTGGLLKRVNATATGTTATLAPGTSTPISLRIFIGFGKINIIITAKAQNAIEISTTKIAFLIGPFVVGIR